MNLIDYWQYYTLAIGFTVSISRFGNIRVVKNEAL